MKAGWPAFWIHECVQLFGFQEGRGRLVANLNEVTACCLQSYIGHGAPIYREGLES